MCIALDLFHLHRYVILAIVSSAYCSFVSRSDVTVFYRVPTFSHLLNTFHNARNDKLCTQRLVEPVDCGAAIAIVGIRPRVSIAVDLVLCALWEGFDGSCRVYRYCVCVHVC